MRADNHQLLQPLFIASFVNAEKTGLKFDAEGTGNGFRIDYRIEGKDTALPTTCKMIRPE
jgi:branched-chain amino acid transport system substrate-binding protein